MIRRSLIDEFANAIANGVHQILTEIRDVERKQHQQYLETKHQLFELGNRLKDIEIAIARSETVVSNRLTFGTTLEFMLSEIDRNLGSELVVIREQVARIAEVTGTNKPRT